MPPEGGPLVVRVQIEFDAIMLVDQIKSTASFRINLYSVWKDTRVAWSRGDFGTERKAVLPRGDVWLPHLPLYTSAIVPWEQQVQQTRIWMWSDGSADDAVPAVVEVNCDFQFQAFPFDEAVCYLRFGTFDYTRYELDLQPMCLGVGPYPEGATLINDNFKISAQGSGWTLERVQFTHHHDYPYSDGTQHPVHPICDEDAGECLPSWLEWRVVLRRESEWYMANGVIPMSVITVLSLLSTWLHTETPKRVVLCITSVLSVATVHRALTQNVPRSGAFSWLDEYFLGCFFFTSISMFLTIFMDYYDRHQNSRLAKGAALHLRAPTMRRLSDLGVVVSERRRSSLNGLEPGAASPRRRPSIKSDDGLVPTKVTVTNLTNLKSVDERPSSELESPTNQPSRRPSLAPSLKSDDGTMPVRAGPTVQVGDASLSTTMSDAVQPSDTQDAAAPELSKGKTMQTLRSAVRVGGTTINAAVSAKREIMTIRISTDTLQIACRVLLPLAYAVFIVYMAVGRDNGTAKWVAPGGPFGDTGTSGKGLGAPWPTFNESTGTNCSAEDYSYSYSYSYSYGGHRAR